MREVFLLATWLCGGLTGCVHQPYQVYDTEAECDVALLRHQNSGTMLRPAAGGLCTSRRLSEQDIEVYRSGTR